ncbi:hypothetical protein ABMA28_009544 [Loxostege sticticalis]|uniref:Uncharacterized protein n=1 Tax=Loxostege sticticalis TaxID=481309 RepID=A0ABD0SDM8_LOXSC
MVEDTTPIQHPVQDPIQVSVQIPTGMGIADPEQETATTPDYSSINIAALDKTVDRAEKSSTKLEKDLVNLIDDLDLKEIIDGMPSLKTKSLMPPNLLICSK